MSHMGKLIEKFKNKPTSVKYRQLKNILEYGGFEEISTKGSHVKFKHTSLLHDIVILIHNNECKDFYKQQILKTIENII